MRKKGDVQNLPLNDEVDFLRKFRDGQGLRNEDKAVVENLPCETEVPCSFFSVRDERNLCSQPHDSLISPPSTARDE